MLLPSRSSSIVPCMLLAIPLFGGCRTAEDLTRASVSCRTLIQQISMMASQDVDECHSFGTSLMSADQHSHSPDSPLYCQFHLDDHTSLQLPLWQLPCWPSGFKSSHSWLLFMIEPVLQQLLVLQQLDTYVTVACW